MTLSHIPVFYSERMVADAQSYSPSAGKPALVVKSWARLSIPLIYREPVAITREQFYLAHDKGYVDGVLDLEMANGFDNRLAEVAMALPYTSGAMAAAAQEAIANKQVAVAPCSGFHHAGYDFAQGFCTFNGLAITALLLKQGGLAKQVGILDFDQHYGNGTSHIIRKLGLTWITHFSAGAHYEKPEQAEVFLDRIPALVGGMSDCDVILYQAGADPHINDPLGGWLTTEQLLIRDAAVFRTAKELGIPVAWNLAGGYQTPIWKVLDIHDNTMRECAEVYL